MNCEPPLFFLGNPNVDYCEERRLLAKVDSFLSGRAVFGSSLERLKDEFSFLMPATGTGVFSTTFCLLDYFGFLLTGLLTSFVNFSCFD